MPCIFFFVDEYEYRITEMLKPVVSFWTDRERPEFIQSLCGYGTAVVVVGKRCVEIISFTSY